ncbi:MAG: lipocalin family protein [bacterium]
MNRKMRYFATFVVMTACLTGLHCGDDNPAGPESALVGTWELISITTLEDGVTFNAGQTIDLGDGATMSMTGTLVITETTYAWSVTVTWTFPGTPPQTETERISGTYTVDGSTLTLTEDGSGDVETAKFSRTGNRLTIEDDEQKMVLEKK